jgi:6-hydroxynicotinate 3-monooxygenase
MRRSQIAIVGAGLGGITAGLSLRRLGFDVKLYEQASGFSRIGAGIQLGPNVLKIMRQLGLESETEAMGSKPDSWISRNWSDGEIIADVPLNRRRDFYGAAYVTVHRGDFHLMLAHALDPGAIEYGCRLISIEEKANHQRLLFADGSEAEADIVIGADGVNSRVREILLGTEDPLYTGYVGHRSIFPAAPLLEQGYDLDSCVKWWSDDQHIMIYYLDSSRKEYYYVTGVPETHWTLDSSHLPSSREEMHNAFVGYHPIIHAIIGASFNIKKWPLLTRKPLSLWSEGRTVLLGDACHPMKPHMAQGAAMAIEDASILARCLSEIGIKRYSAAFELYRANRMERATRVQANSNANTWLRSNENPDWVFAYDAINTPLLESTKR